MSSSSQPPNPGQLPSNLPGVSAYLTGHNEQGQAIVQSARPGKWTAFDGDKMEFDVVYTTSQFPADLNDDKDIQAHDALMGSKKLGLVNPGGSVCRVVDFAPGYDCMMHRTRSLDYGIVLEGSIELLLDSGEKQLMHRGDVAVQRATMHAWRNPSETEWARMIFVLQDCKELVVAGQSLGEDLGRGTEGLPASGNDK
ncbi:hypothetical protein BJ546DRAFT_158679 [Cryomyces antarcticus]|uniref:Cupin type-2 domain-containing protein n=1 Tax=Cryomyces antarcticus TaxID=329879 RepID=A0ABR0LP14_9PEZI|nr:hypothetical protein LTR04_007178 [Oleoguttula sp. CCFEE 6159]KAK5201283.1 hypothetical protein LTR16_003242 [Cryomyces antarcticus]